MVTKVQVVDSHTEGEPTRVVIGGAPDLPSGTAAERLQVLRERFGTFRSSVLSEPRGFDAMVGALLLEPQRETAIAQVVFFNNIGYLGGCVHGTIGVTETLRHLGRIAIGDRRVIETPVGAVTVEVLADGRVAVENVESFRFRKAVVVETSGHGTVTGDVAWGGNWFFLVSDHGQELALDRIAALTDFAQDLRDSLRRAGVTGRDGREIDHVELFGPPTRPDADSRNFVLCPGGEYDRSPCGTGTSAKLACLAADGRLGEGQEWRQESIVGSRFTGTVRRTAAGVVPRITGRAFVTAEATLWMHPDDPFGAGIRR